MASYGGSQLGPWMGAREEDDTIAPRWVLSMEVTLAKGEWPGPYTKEISVNGRKPAALVRSKQEDRNDEDCAYGGVGTVLRGTQPTDRAASRHTA